MAARQLYQCLIDYSRDEAQKPEFSPTASPVLSDSSLVAQRAEQSARDGRGELELSEQILIIAAGRVAVFAAAWAMKDYVTLFELLQGKQIDQLTKRAVSPWSQGPTASLASQNLIQADVDRFEAEQRKSGNRESVESNDDGELSPRSDGAPREFRAVLPKRANDYLERLLTLLILVRFSATLEQFLAVNSIADAEQSLLMKQLSACQVT